jgi:hypothetical protein
MRGRIKGQFFNLISQCPGKSTSPGSKLIRGNSLIWAVKPQKGLAVRFPVDRETPSERSQVTYEEKSSAGRTRQKSN